MIWSSIEPTVGVLCACLPTLGPVLNRHALESMISSVLSFFTIHSNHSEATSVPLSLDRPKKPKNDATARPFYPMDDEQSLVTDARGQRDSPEEGNTLSSKKIQVDTSFNMEVEGRNRRA